MGQKSIVIDRPVHDVFARVTDLERAREWAPQMGKMRLDGPIREGATMIEERRMFGRTMNATWSITRLSRTVQWASAFGSDRSADALHTSSNLRVPERS